MVGTDELQANYQELLDTGVLQTNINTKLEALEEEYAPKLTETNRQLAHTVKRNENESIGMEMFKPEVKQALSDGEWNVNVNTSEIENGAVTYEKTNFEDEISFRIKNLSKNGGITKDSNNDGIADGFVSHGANVVNPQVVNNEQRWTSLTTGFSGSIS